MTTPQELQEKFWNSLGSDRTVMLGVPGMDEGHALPMTAQFENDRPPIWFFTSKDNSLVRAIRAGAPAVASFVSKGHDIFATVHGQLCMDNDPAVIDRLWNRFVAAWYEGGKTDPNLALLRFDAERAQIWLSDTGLLAGVKILLGADPKQEYRDHVAEVRLG